MPVHVGWYHSPHVIISFWEGDITRQDIEDCAEHLRELFAEAEAIAASDAASDAEVEVEVKVETSIYLLNDVGDITSPFMNMGALRSLMRDTLSDPRNVLMVSYRINNPIVHFLTQFVARVFSLNVRAFESWEAARAYLKSLNSGIDFSERPLPQNASNQK